MASSPHSNGARHHQQSRTGAAPLLSAPPSSASMSIASSSTSVNRQGMHAPTLQSDRVVFQHAKLPSRQGASAGAAPLSGRPSSQAYAGGSSRSGSNALPGGGGGAAYSNAWPPYEQTDRLQHAHNGSSNASCSTGRRQDYAVAESYHPYSSHVRSDTALLNQRPQQHRRHLHPDHGADSGGQAAASAAAFAHVVHSSAASAPRSTQQQQQHQPLDTTARAPSPSSHNVPPHIVRMTIRVLKEGNKLGFGIRHDANQKLRVSTLQGNSAAAKSPLRLGDILLSVNGIALHDLGFLEVIQHLKATKPGELVFEVERDVNASPNHAYEYPSTELDLAEDYIGDPPSSYMPLPHASGRASGHASAAAGSGPPSRQPSPPMQSQLQQQQQPSRSMPAPAPASLAPHASPATTTTATAASGALGGAKATGYAPPGAASAPANGPGPMAPPNEPSRKRERPVSSGDAADVAKMEKTHKQVVNTLVLELKKERSEKAALDDKNNALRKRLQKMLIECDVARVRASTEVATMKETAKRQVQQLEQALSVAKAQLRLQDRGPSVARTDSLVNDLATCKAQLDRLKRAEADRSAQLAARFSLENRHADREAHRVREQLVTLFRTQLRQVAKRSANPAPAATGAAGSKAESGQVVTVTYDGLRRLAFLKLFGFPHNLEQYASPEFYSLAHIHRSLEHDEFADLFGTALAHEERAGIFVVAVAPMDVAYDPSTERLSLVCGWTEQNTIRELARNFRF